MKMIVVVEIDVSKTLGQTMQRSGFTLAPDGSGMQVVVANAPPVPQRKTKVTFIEHPTIPVDELIAKYASVPPPPST
jgi:hypothetical protein